MSAGSGGLEIRVLWDEASFILSRGDIIGCSIKILSAGFTIASLLGGLRVIMEFRRVLSKFLIVEIFGMVVV